MASSRYGTSRRFTMNPVLSLVRTGTLPSFLPNSTAVSKTSSAVAIVRTTSTNFINGTGLKKCRPTKRSGRLVAVMSSVMESDEVLEAKMVLFFTIWSSAAYILRFSSKFSMMASTMRSQSARSSFLVVPLISASIALFCCAVMPPFSGGRSAKFASDFSMPANPLSRNFCSASSTMTSQPAMALTCAMPEPIRPQPKTPTFLISIDSPLLLHPERSAGTLLTPDESRLKSFHFGLLKKKLREAFHDDRDSLPAANACRRQTIFLLAATQFVEQREHQPRSSRTQRMSQRDGAAVHVHPVAVESQLFFDGRSEEHTSELQS